MAKNRDGKFLKNFSQALGGITGGLNGISAGVQGASVPTYDNTISAPYKEQSFLEKNMMFLGVGMLGLLFIVTKK